MLLFFIYAALGVELFGRLGECGHSVPLPQGDAGPQRGGSCVYPTTPPHRFIESTGYWPRPSSPRAFWCVLRLPVHLHLASPLFQAGTHLCTQAHLEACSQMCDARDHTQASQAGPHSGVNVCTGRRAHTGTSPCLTLNIVPRKGCQRWVFCIITADKSETSFCLG